MDGVFIYEFLFRGGATSSPDDDTWHVILAREARDILGNPKLELTPALTPTRAAEMGFTLDRILSSLNTTAVESLSTYRTERDDAVAERDAHAEELSALKARVAKTAGADDASERQLSK